MSANSEWLEARVQHIGVDADRPAAPAWGGMLGSLFVLGEHLRLLWALLAVDFVIAFAAYIAVSPNYTAEAVIAPPGPSPTDSMMSAPLGAASGLSSRLLGGVGGSRNDPYQEYVHLLGSKRLRQALVATPGLMPTVFHKKWSSEKNAWKEPGPLHVVMDPIKQLLHRPVERKPGIDDLTRYLSKRLVVTKVESASGTLMTAVEFNRVSLNFDDREQAEQILNTILLEADNIIREDQKRDVTARIAFVHKELLKPDLTVDERSALISILSNQELLLAMVTANSRYAYTLVAPPYSPAAPAFPPPPAIVIVLVVVTSVLIWVALVVYGTNYRLIERFVARFRKRPKFAAA